MNEAKTMEYITVMMVRLLEADGPLTGKEMMRGLAVSRDKLERVKQDAALGEAFGAMRRAEMVTDMSTNETSRWALTHRGRLTAQVLAEEAA